MGPERHESAASWSLGQGLAEYALLLALIAIVAIVALVFLGSAISGVFSTLGNMAPFR